MRDPAASLCFEADRVVRHLKMPISDGHFLLSDLAKRLTKRGDLVPFELLDERTVASPRLPFVSYPNEWCDWQLHAAGELTLRLQSDANEFGYDLKDASAWNVIFDGTRPVFCDHLSFEPLRRRRWWAAGQFARHFVFPLLASGRRGLLAHQCFDVWRDGVPPEVARTLLGPSRYLTRYWPLMAQERGNGLRVVQERSPEQPSEILGFRQGLNASLRWMLSGVRPKVEKKVVSTWQHYVHERSHYSETDLERKRAAVAEWIRDCRAGTVLDLGCNSGEFSRIAAGQGARVIAADADHGAIQKLCAELPLQPAIHPLIAVLDDLGGGRGWAGLEFRGLTDRLQDQPDLTLMLALIHHLCIAAAVPLQAVVKWIGSVTGRWLIVELLDSEDPQVQLLCAQRNREPSEFGLAAMKAAFIADGGWVLRQEIALANRGRLLCLMERASTAQGS